jgi:hypothetical protein
MSGSAVVPFPAGAGVCDSAVPPRLPSRSEAAPAATKTGFEMADIGLNPDKASTQFIGDEFWKGLPSIRDGLISIHSVG